MSSPVDTLARLPPHDPDAERGVLSCMLQWPHECIPVAQHAIRGPEFFYDLRHQTIFEAICGVYDRAGSVDLITLQSSLRNNALLESVGGLTYLNQICDVGVSSEQLGYYLEILREKDHRRRILQSATHAIATAYEESVPAQEIASALVSDMTGTVEEETGAEFGAEQLVNDFIADSEAGEPPHLTPTGFPSLDSVYTPRAGDLYLIGARPSVGKSSLAGSMALRMATRETAPMRIGYISMEMTPASLIHRMISQASGIPLSIVNNPDRHRTLLVEEINRITTAANVLRGTSIRFSRARGMTIERLCALTMYWKRRHGLDAIFVDYIGRLPNPKGIRDRIAAVSHISSRLKDLAMDLDITVFAMAQINREAGDPNERPRLHHLRDSGSLEQDADVVVLMQRHVREGGQSGVFAHLDKARNGATQAGIFLPFHGPTTTFSDEMFESPAEPQQPERSILPEPPAQRRIDFDEPQ